MTRRFGPAPHRLAVSFALSLAIALGILALPAAAFAAPHAPHKTGKKHRCVRPRHGRKTHRRCAKKHAPPAPTPIGPPAPAPDAPISTPTDRGAEPSPPSEPHAGSPVESPGGQPGGDGGDGGDGGGGSSPPPPPPEFETVDLVTHGDFEPSEASPFGCFEPNHEDGVLSTDQTDPLAGTQSLGVKLKAFGRVACGHEWGEGEGPMVNKVSLSGDLRIEAPSSGDTNDRLKVCAIVYYDGNPDPESKCQMVDVDDHQTVHVEVEDPIAEQRIQRIFFQLEAGSVAIEAALDEAHLWIERRHGSEGGHGGGAGDGGGGSPGSNVGRFAAMISPTDGETFTTPSDLNLRLIGIGHDPNIFTNSNKDGEEDPGHGTNAAKVEFLLDGRVIGEEKGAPEHPGEAGVFAEYHVFKTFADGLSVTPGQHEVVARAVFENPAETIESEPATITVLPEPNYAKTVTLDHDIVLGTSESSFELIGAPGARIKLNGNGHRIISTGTGGKLALKYVDVSNLGDPVNSSQPGIEVTAHGSGAVEIEHSTFDFSDPVDLELNNTVTATFDDNLFRSNMRMPIGQEPGSDPTGVSPTVPVIAITGNSTGHKEFAGNNIGAAPVQFERVNHWTIGGPTDADTNVLIGPRAAFEVLRSANVTVEGNFINHVYYGGWSQGQLLELSETKPIEVEHNVLLDSSWPVRGIEGEFAYNLVLEAGHQWMVPADGAYIHNNIFVGGDNDVGGITEYYPDSTRIENNTFDGLMGPMVRAAIYWEQGQTTLKSNAFIGFPTWAAAVVDDAGGKIEAGFNGFFNPLETNYLGAEVTSGHDVSGVDPEFAGPLPTDTFEGEKVKVWNRQLPVSQILAEYRARFTPTQGSPYIDAGDPSACACNDIGAVGAGTQVNPLDRFGSFAQPGWVPPPTPPRP